MVGAQIWGCAGDGNALTLPAGEFDAALSHLRGIPFGLGQDEIMGVGYLGSGNNRFLAGTLASVCNVFRDRGGKEIGILRYKRDLRSQASQVCFRQIVAKD